MGKKDEKINVPNFAANLFESVATIVQKAINDAQTSLTVEVEIVKAVDEGQGIYEVRYLGNSFEATSADRGIIYTPGELVNLLVIGADWSKSKIILSSVSNKNTNYASTKQEDLLLPIGENLFNFSDETIQLSTYETEEKELVKYDEKDYSEEIKGFEQLFNSSLKDSRKFNLTYRIRTNIEQARRLDGNYGLKLSLPVKQEGIETSYDITFDINDMYGDPYRFQEYALQNFYFDFPEDMELDLNRKISFFAFVKDFPYPNNESGHDPDIWIKDIKLISILDIPKEERTGYQVILTASGGTSFLAGRTDDKKTIVPTVYLDGRVTGVNNFNCYWFRENYLINTSSEKYNRIGGEGWEILNRKTNTKTEAGGKETFQYVLNDYTLKIVQTGIHTGTRYKCVLVKGEDILEGYITIKNLAKKADFTLQSATGSTNYAKNVGRVRILSRYYENGITDVSENSKDVPNICYSWKIADKNNKNLDLNGIDFSVDRLNEKVTIDEKKYFETEVSYDAKKLDEKNIIYCTAYQEYVPDGESVVVQSPLGSTSVMVTEGAPAISTKHKILLTGGDKLYKYDVDGDSPKVANYDGPVSSMITDEEPLSIVLYTSEGREFTADEYAMTHVEWLVPLKDESMIEVTNHYDIFTNPGYYTIGTFKKKEDKVDEYEKEDEYNYNNYKTLDYDILPTFNKNKNNNTIIVKVKFKKDTVEESTTIRFIKDGESGRNGSKYTAIIEQGGDDTGWYAYGEKDAAGRIRKLQMVYVASGDPNKVGWYRYRAGLVDNSNENTYKPLSFRKLEGTLVSDKFRLKLYADGEVINSSADAEWSIVDSNLKSDNPEKNEEVLSSPVIWKDNALYLKNSTITWTDNFNYGAILQAKCKAKKINSDEGTTETEEYVYAYYPIEMTKLSSDKLLNGMIPSIDKGFSDVVYASDGTNPQYESSKHFELYSGGLFEQDVIDKIYYNYNQKTYKWTSLGNIKTGKNTDRDTYNPSPYTKYDNGLAVNGVTLKIMGNTIIGTQCNTERGTARKLKESAEGKKIYFEKLKTSLQKVYSDYTNSYFSYCNYLKENAKVFLTKGNLIRTEENLLKDLNRIDSLLNKYSDEKLTPIKEQINETNGLKHKYEILSNTTKLCVMDTTSLLNLIKIPFNDLIINLEGFMAKESYEITIYDTIKGYNSKVENVYGTYYNDIYDEESIPKEGFVKAAEKIRLNVYNPLINYINISDWDTLKGEGDKKYLFSQLHLTIQSYIFSFDKNYTYTADKVINRILNPIKEALEPYKNINFNKEIEEYTKQFELYEKKYNLCDRLISYLPIDSNDYILHVKPIMFSFNRYEMAHINGWDGNKLKTTDGYLLAPQVGAGIKENGFFTGMIMGIKQPYVSSQVEKDKQKIGLLGYKEGVQTLYLNARDGSAIFGKSDAGQIIIDPKRSKALLYSSKYWHDYDASGKPLNYKKELWKEDGTGGNRTGEGMIIDLSTPEIRFGNENFSVTKEGHLTAKGGGSIGGWEIGNTTLSSISENKNKLVLDSGLDNNGKNGMPKIYSNSHSTFDNTENGFYLSEKGLSIGDSIKISSQEGGKILIGRIGEKFGTSYLGNYWTISGDNRNSYIAYNTKTWDAQNNENNSVYLGTDGIRLGKTFKVTAGGELTATSGTIGGWEIREKEITKGSTHLYDSGKLEGPTWSIDSYGNATFNHISCNGYWDFGTSNNSWSSNSGLQIGTVRKENQEIVGKGIHVSEKGDLVIRGDIYANNGYFNGKVVAESLSIKENIECECKGVKFMTDEHHYLKFGADENSHPTVSGLNIGEGGLALQLNSISEVNSMTVNELKHSSDWYHALILDDHVAVRYGGEILSPSLSPMNFYSSGEHGTAIDRVDVYTGITGVIRDQNGIDWYFKKGILCGRATDPTPITYTAHDRPEYFSYDG